jgi:ABC-type spermidine/putrescine transport system permease subunit I
MSSPARSAAWRPLLWLSPAAFILIPFFFVPLTLLLRNSLNRDDPLLLMVPDFSFANYAKALGDGFYLQLFVNTIGAAAVVAIVATVIA